MLKSYEVKAWLVVMVSSDLFKPQSLQRFRKKRKVALVAMVKIAIARSRYDGK